MYNPISLDTVCASLSYAMGIAPPAKAAAPNPVITEYVDKAFNGKKADRIFMYNPDAVAEWIFRKYHELVAEVENNADIETPIRTVMPSVTPVCFATMYTGTQPEVHGIRKYEKPILKAETIFDRLIEEGKKVAIIAIRGGSMGTIFGERNIDYFLYDNIPDINAKAVELILRDEHDFIIAYNEDYDYNMHKTGPESKESLGALRCNAKAFAMFNKLIKNHWQKHNTFVGFAMDHGCHEIDGGAGSHGLDMPEDINIVHYFKAYPAEN